MSGKKGKLFKLSEGRKWKPRKSRKREPSRTREKVMIGKGGNDHARCKKTDSGEKSKKGGGTQKKTIIAEQTQGKKKRGPR